MLKQELARLAATLFSEPIPAAPECEFTIAPKGAQDAAAVLEFAAQNQLKVLFWGGGTHQGLGYRLNPDIVMTTASLDRIVDWQPDDLTVVVEPGVRVANLEAKLGEQNQTAVLQENPGSATVGGSVAAGVSGWRRLRYGPTRDRSLGVRLATGDGRLIRGGGRLVKNVTGYDLPRLATGSFGSLGLITEMCIKLWPRPERTVTVQVDTPAAALRVAYRPLAVVETRDQALVYLTGSAAEVDEQLSRLGGASTEGHSWPEPLAGDIAGSLRVPPGELSGFVAAVRELGVPFQAAHGVGELRFTPTTEQADALVSLRTRAEGVGGALVVEDEFGRFDIDPWGSPPKSIALQRRVKEAFDPMGVANPGRLPGRL